MLFDKLLFFFNFLKFKFVLQKFKFVSMKTGNDIIGLDKSSTKSALNSSAHNANLCDVGNTWEMTRWSFISKVKSDILLSVIDKAMLLLLLQHGLRVSEVIRISRGQLLGHGRVLIKASKGSNDRVLERVEYYEAIEHFLLCFNSLGEIFSRFYLYRLCLKMNINFENNYGKKNSVTHAGRHLYAESLSAQSVQLETISRQMGHKSTKSTEHYVKQSKKQK